MGSPSPKGVISFASGEGGLHQWIFQSPCWPPGPLSLWSHLLHISKAGPSQPRLPAFQVPIWSLHNGTDPPASDRPLVPPFSAQCSLASGHAQSAFFLAALDILLLIIKTFPLTMERSSGRSLHCTPTYIIIIIFFTITIILILLMQGGKGICLSLANFS